MDALELYFEIIDLQETDQKNDCMDLSGGLTEAFGRDAAVSIMAAI